MDEIVQKCLGQGKQSQRNCGPDLDPTEDLWVELKKACKSKDAYKPTHLHQFYQEE